MKKILVITTGGTIDAEPYEETPIDITPLKETMIPKALDILGLSEQCAMYKFCMKDSKDISQSDLEHIASIIEQNTQNYDGFLITHGTDTMPENGRALKTLLNIEKPVALVGAMEPLLNGKSATSPEDINNATSDGWKNLHYAATHIMVQDAGVYVAAQEQMMPVDNLAKNFDLKQFYIAGHSGGGI